MSNDVFRLLVVTVGWVAFVTTYLILMLYREGLL